MDWNQRCAVIVPCFNEALHLGRVVEKARQHLATVIVVNDGSTDATAETARRSGAMVFSLPKNSGKGIALCHGWQQARRLGFSWALMLDGDGQHDADEIPKFFRQAEQGRAALIVGNRMQNPAAMPVTRRWVNRWMSRRISHLTGAELPDSQCGFRLARLDTLLALSLRGNRFEIESAMLTSFLAAGEQVEFVPVRCIYEREASKINPFTDTFRWLRWRLAQRAALRACSTIRVP